MEVGAVKQAYNNEVIHLKKKFNQAKIQIIHKLTRKAKSLTDKKCPENIKEKFNKKAKSAVEEVLILKKITNKELAKFAVSHKGQLQDHLNKPTVDKDKACARLLLHKCLEDKYTFFRSRFSNMPIEDLVMSREERRKIKKEEKEKQKNKKKAKEEKRKNKLISSEGDWNVEDIDVNNASKNDSGSINKIANDFSDSEATDELDIDNQLDAQSNQVLNNDDKSVHSSSEECGNEDSDEENSEISSGRNNIADEDMSSEVDDNEMEATNQTSSKTESSDVESNPEEKVTDKLDTKNNMNKSLKAWTPEPIKKTFKVDNRKKLPKKTKDGSKNKTKKFSEKIQAKKVKQDISEPSAMLNKIVDPFFKTSSGENYISLAEPRAADEVLEVHRQGNRQIRRAKMFGHELKFKPRRQNNQNNDRFINKKIEAQNNSFKRGNNSRQNDFRGDGNKFETQNGKWSYQDKGGFGNNGRNKINFTDRNAPQQKMIEKSSEPEKLHPSWEAKKKKSGILPFEGKKIVFD